MISNLERERPEVWRGTELYSFIEDCWNNSIATVGNKNVVASRLGIIDGLFNEFQLNLKPNDQLQLVPILLFIRCFCAYRTNVMVSLCMPTEGYALSRLCLENAGYAHLIASSVGLSELWLRRDETAETRKLVRNKFTQKAVRDLIESRDPKLGKIYQMLYERSIDFGAHPNEKASTVNLVRESLNTNNVQSKLLGDDGLALDHSLKTTAQVGICVLKIFALIFAKEFGALNLIDRIEFASRGL